MSTLLSTSGSTVFLFVLGAVSLGYWYVVVAAETLGVGPLNQIEPVDDFDR